MDETRRRSQQACDNHSWFGEGEFPGGMLIIATRLSLRMGFLHHES